MKLILPIVALMIVISAMAFRNHNNILSKKSKADKIINKAIATHGGKRIKNSKISFDFRNRQYVATRNNGTFKYERIFTNEEGEKVHDTLTNSDFTRTINGSKAEVTQKKADAYTNSVNSVIYFALLPYFLNDAAVNKEYLGEEIIKNRAYHKIKVTFQQEGGGKDYEDEYIYWIHKEHYTLDYLAYNYQVEGGGARFRAAYNIRKIKGIRFADYINYKPLEKDNLDVASFGQLYQNDQLKELSRIETENIQVDLK